MHEQHCASDTTPGQIKPLPPCLPVEPDVNSGLMATSQTYFTPAEVAVHNTHTDCWVSFLGRVFDLTKLVADNEGVLTQPIVASAGTDISHWFNPQTGDVRAVLVVFLSWTQRRSSHVRARRFEPTSTP